VLGGLCVLVLAAGLASVAQASPPAKGQYHLNAPSAGGDPPTQPGQAVSTNDGGSSSTLWIIVAAAVVAAIGTGVLYTRGRNEPPADR
jgi:hypothetical protein